jgi:hypothetical protein
VEPGERRSIDVRKGLLLRVDGQVIEGRRTIWNRFFQ